LPLAHELGRLQRKLPCEVGQRLLHGQSQYPFDSRLCAGSSHEVREHEAVALIGASGSGKSTRLRCIDLLEEIDDGDVFLDGEVITDPSVAPVAVRRRRRVPRPSASCAACSTPADCRHVRV
jgi:ABC-type bacteriocin/lantibiotic exporter with double-glycine peptidase domain